MKIWLLSLALWLPMTSITAQNAHVESIIHSIEANNKTLKAFQKEVEAQKAGNNTELTLTDPEVEFNYLWGKASETGHRMDFNVSQNFDYATLSGAKRQTARSRNALIELEGRKMRIEVVQEARTNLVELNYYNALRAEQRKLLQHAQLLLEAYKKKAEQGTDNLLNINKAQLNLSTSKAELERTEIERGTLLESLKRMNGGIKVEFEDSVLKVESILESFDSWFSNAQQNSSILRHVGMQIEASKQEFKLAKAMNLPSLTAGYMSEHTPNEILQGVSFGLSIPLWENRGKLKQARASISASESMAEDEKEKFYTEVFTLYQKIEKLRQIAIESRTAFDKFNNQVLLDRALREGSLSLLDYLDEVKFISETYIQVLQAEREYLLAKAMLEKYKM